MKRFLLTAFLFNLIFTTEISAQCPGCLINTGFTSPGIYPNPLPDGTQGQPYDQDVTFVMFTDTSGFTVNYFKILGVNNLPFGLNWQCNSTGNGCQYDPQVSIYGCVKVCGIPLQTGTFTVAVNVVANFPFPVGDQYSTIDIVVTILPASGGNSGFSYTPLGGCDSATIDFLALITSATNPVTYNWDFGNGNTGTQISETQTYTDSGNYEVTLQTEILGFILTDIAVNSVNNNWCGDVEEPNIFGCQGDPDLVAVITDAGGNTLYTSPELTDQNSGSWNGLNIALSNPPYSITIWDIDVISANDNLGSFAFNGNAAGNFPYNGAGGTSGSLNIGTTILSTFNDTSIIHISNSPVIPVISISPNDSICFGDSVSLSISNSNGDAVQWIQNGLEIINGTNNQISVTETGAFAVTVINTDGCASYSDSVIITELPALPAINFQISNDTLTAFLTQYNLQWCLNGLPISGATSSVYVYTQTGDYYLIAIDELGCQRSSDTFHLNFDFIINEDDENELSIYPVPAQDFIHVELIEGNIENLKVSINDISGKKIIAYDIKMATVMKKNVFTIDTKILTNGIYSLKIQSDKKVINRKIIVQR